MHVCLYVYECALLEGWVYVLCCVSCLSLFLPILHYFYTAFRRYKRMSFAETSDGSFLKYYRAIVSVFEYQLYVLVICM